MSYSEEYIVKEFDAFVSEHFSGLGEISGESIKKQNMKYLESDTFFFKIFKIAAKNLPPGFDEEGFINSIINLPQVKRIQSLIDLIQSDEKFEIDLGYIKGKEIVKGNVNHIRNLLQLLFSISRPKEFNDAVDEVEDDINKFYTDKEEGELNQEYVQKIGGIEQHATFNPNNRNRQSGEFGTDYEQQLKPKGIGNKKTKKKRALSKPGVKRHIPRARSSGIGGVKRAIVTSIEQNIHPSLFAKKKLRPHKAIKNQMPVLNLESQMEIVNQLQLEEAMEEYIDENLYDQDNKLRNMLIKKGLNEKELEEMMKKQKRKYMHSLYDYMNFINRKEQSKNDRSQTIKELNFRKKMKAMEIYKDKVEEELKHEALSMQYKLRDEQANYMRAINKIIFELKKKKMVEEKKLFKEDREERVKQTYVVMSSIENFYKDQISMIKDQLAKEKIDRKRADVAQRKMLAEMERDLRTENKRKMKNMIHKWKQEKGKFNNFLKEDADLEAQFLQLFKKYQLN